MLLSLLALSAGTSSEFSFAIPPGWHQISPDFSSLERQGVAPEVAQLARGPAYALFAVAPTGGHCPPTMTAGVLPGPFHLTNRTLASVVRGIQESATRAGAELEVREAKVVEHDGNNIGVIRSSVSLLGCRYEQVAYLLPGSSHMAQLVFSATQAELSGVERVAEDAAFHTGGIRDDAIVARLVGGLAFDNSGDRDFALGVVAGVCGVCAAGVWLGWRVALRRRRGRITTA